MKKSSAIWIFILVFLLFNLVMYLTKLGGEQTLLYVSDTLPIAGSLVSVVCLFMAFTGFRNFDYAKIAWFLIFLGIALDFIAETIYAILEIGIGLDMNQNFPSIADIFWCCGYIPLFYGLFLMFMGYKKSGFPLGNTRRYLTLAVIIVILTSAVFYFVLLPILQDSETTGLTKFVSMLYPIFDVLVVIPAIILMYITSLFGKGSLSRPWKYLAIGFICFTAGDLFYSYMSWQDLYGSGNLIDIAWNVGYLLIGMAGLYQRELIDSMKGGV